MNQVAVVVEMMETLGHIKQETIAQTMVKLKVWVGQEVRHVSLRDVGEMGRSG